MKTYPIYGKDGTRSPIFQIDSVYIGISSLVQLLNTVPGVGNVRKRKPLSSTEDVHVEFEYLGRRYMVWEPYGDNSRYWVGPQDMVSGNDPVKALDSPSDINALEDAFKDYSPPLVRRLIGGVLTMSLR